MAQKKAYIIPGQRQRWGGVNKAESQRGELVFVEDSVNLDSNLEHGELVSRKGYASVVDTTTDSLVKAHAYRDAEWGKDVLLTYEKDGTTANRRIWLFNQNLGAGGTYAKQSEHSYGTVELGDDISFLQHRNTVRIGTGTGVNNKALFAGYIDRTGVNGMFDEGNFDQAAFYLLKSQWVEKAHQMNGLVKVVWDLVNSVYYCLTFRGVEIRDTNFKLTRILDDVVSWAIDDTTDDPKVIGDLDITTLRLVAVGKVPNSTDTKIVIYDLLNDYDIVTSSTKSSPEFFHHCAIEGSTLWFTYDDGTDGHIAQTGLVSPMVLTDRYGAGVGDQNLYGLDTDGTYVYVMDNDNQRIIRMEDSGAFGTSMYSPGIAASFTHYDLVISGNDLWFLVSDNTTAEIYEADKSSWPPASETKVDDLDGSSTLGLTCSGVNIVNSVPMVFSPRGIIKKYDDTTNWNDDGFIPGKAFMNAVWVEGSSHSSNKMYFYGFCIEDIYGQQTHLMSGCAIRADLADKVKLTIYLNAESELYEELTSPSQSPGSDPSIWGMYRRIKKIHLFRAQNSTADAKEPTTNYQFLDTLEIDTPKWTLLNPSGSNYLSAYYVYVDDITDISSVTYEEFAGLPEDFEPFYTNWQYAKEHLDSYYFGNVRTDDLYEQQIIRSPPNAPDMNYQLSANIDLFFPDDGDEIKGFGVSWNRLIVFKGEKSAIYNSLTREQIFDVGLQSPDSVISHNNVVYFQSTDGFYLLTPSGYQRISLPVDADLASETLGPVSVVHHRTKQKLWWLVPSSKSYLWNLNTKTWDKYDLDTGSITHIFVLPGLDGKILACADSNGQVYEQDNTFQDAGQDIPLSLETKRILTGSEFEQEDHDEVFITYDSPATFTLTAKQINENGETTFSLTSIPTQTLLMTERRFVSAFGQAMYFTISVSVNTKQFRLKALGLTTLASKAEIQAA